MCPSFKNLLSNSQTLRQCYFHLLRVTFKRPKRASNYDVHSPLIHVYVILLNIIESVKTIVLQWLVVYLSRMIFCMYCFYTMYMCDLWTSFFSRGDQLDCIALLTYLFPNIYIRNLDIHYFSCRFVFFYCFFLFFLFLFFFVFWRLKKAIYLFHTNCNWSAYLLSLIICRVRHFGLSLGRRVG